MARRGRKRKLNKTRRARGAPPNFESLLRQAEKLDIKRIITRKKIRRGPRRGQFLQLTESDDNFYHRLWVKCRAGELAASENPIDILVHKGFINEHQQAEAHRLRRIYTSLFGNPEPSTGAYGNVTGPGQPNDSFAAEWEAKRIILEGVSRYTLGAVVSCAVFRQEPKDVPAIRLGLKAIVDQWFTGK